MSTTTDDLEPTASRAHTRGKGSSRVRTPLPFPDLRRIAQKSLRAKPKRARRTYVDKQLVKGRKALVFPKLTWAHRPHDFVRAGLTYQARTYYDDVDTYLDDWDDRILNDVWLAGFEPPTEDQLYVLFSEWVLSHVAPGARYGLSENDVRAVCTHRAGQILKTWSPTYIERMQMIGGKGGRTGSKGNRKTPRWRLDWLREHPQTGATDAAKALRLKSRTQVYTLRARIKAEDAKAELELLFGPEPVNPEPVSVPRDMSVDDWDFEPVPVSVPRDISMDDCDLEPMTPEVDDWDLEPVSENDEPSYMHLDFEPVPVRQKSWTETFDFEQMKADQEAKGAAEHVDDILSILDSTTEAPEATSEDVWDNVIYLDKYRSSRTPGDQLASNALATWPPGQDAL